jgi:uncharacterized protein (TIGR03067 family)
MRRRVILLLAAASLAFAPAPLPKPGPNDKDLKGLQGTWIGPGNLVARFEDDTLRYYRGGELVRSYRITINALVRPKAMDLVGIGADKDRLRYFMIYNLDGDTLKTSSNGWDEPRPTAFEGKGRGRAVEFFQRKKQ